MKDPTEFKQRFADWKAGNKVYDAGRPITDDEYYSTMERVAKENWQKWGDSSEDAALTRILNANDYDYRGYYDKYPNSRANSDTHWTDEFKTVYHPTFSEESRYSGKKSKFNPDGLKGGSWGENGKFYPQNWQMFGTKHSNLKRPLPKYDGGTDDKTYLPEYEYEATVTPQGTSLEKHKRITNEEDWQKYWGNVGAGYVNKAQESVAKPILEGLKTASYFTPLGNATAFGDLLAANINGDKDEVLASAAGLLPQVRWARNAYKTGKQLMSLNQLWDRHYFHALNDKDLRGVKNLRDAHFIVNAPNTKIKNGDLPVTLYHGTPNKGWNEYDPKFFGSNTDDGYYGKGLYLTETLDDALAYAGIKDRNFEKFTGTKNPYLKRLYVNSETPFVSGALNNDFKIATANEASDRAMLAPHFGRDLKFKIGTPGSESGTVYIPNDMIYDPTLVRELENADASIFSNVLHHIDRDPTIVKFDEVIVPKSSQMKYVDPITYDDFGNIVPLSMRDNFSNPDFRFDKGKSIHINPANRGKFKATMKRTGKTTEQLAHSKNPLTRKRAIFALNSRKFKH